MAWHIMEKLVEQVAQHSTLVGKFWSTFFFVLRFLMVVSIADSVFGDEQGAFVCNTLTPGCSNVCFNDFSPISLIRLWALQILGVSLPTVIFMVYTAHKMEKISQAKKIRKEEQEKVKKQKEEAKKIRDEARKKMIEDKKRRAAEGHPPDYNHEPTVVAKKEEKKDDGDDDKVVATQLTEDNPSRLMLAYVAQVVFRLTVEVVFMVVQFNTYVYKFWVPELFKCSRWPCPDVVDCFISRPKEKTIMLWIMFGTGLIMILLCLIELYHIGTTKIMEAWRDRGQDITKEYKQVTNSMPSFGRHHGRYQRGYPQAVGIRVGYARSSLSGEGGNDFDGDEFI